LFATIVIAVAQEEGWPVRMVLFDHHAAARYEDGRGEKFYIDLMGGEPGPPEERYTDEWGTKDFRVVSDNGVKACAHERLGYEYRNQEKYDLAIKHDEAAIGLEPKHAGAIANLGLTFFAYGKYIGFEKALEYYRKADKLLSQAISLSNVEKIKGYMLIEQAGVKDLLGDQSGAIECLTLAIKTLEDSGYFWNSDYEKAYLYRAGIKAYVLDYQGAKADIEVVIAEGKKKGEERKKLTDRIAEYEKLDEQQSLARKIEMSSSLRFAYLIRGPIF
jgi:tetratricopeptide (TPR) repeat protein